MKFLIVVGLVFFLCACHSAPAQKNLPDFRENQPRSILVMPPMNRSIDIRAPAVFLATSSIPLAESGYYVIPVALSQEMFRQNGIHTAETAHAIEPGRLREIFGADAALYITITRFGVSYQVLRSVVQASAYARLVDLRTGQVLWSGLTQVENNTGNFVKVSDGNAGQQILGMIIGAAIEQVINVILDPSYDIGRQANHLLLSAENRDSILFGPYHPKFGTD
jgi:hypothetical protein